ncbi:hypothetical protein SAMN04487765_3241 [Tenacibaculum sp. MAR_2010_89]|uniref:hypothetical protein n=1 Tax=Tenacibaculum sp. MAR_2010_89 TaxID=1250198 RepID=UPI0008983B4E|nr:hypothetical protein [Tenacibaculum sp. MAR_2010_89]SEE58298.1 hypothetical protein SAMN04487765_3241 [Tenacibaculum sp. MAR_2010_89]
MDINISYYLAEHGWSTCWINTKDKTYEMSITHIFHEDPIEECMNCILRMINGQKNSEFKWYGEPGGERITLKEVETEKNMIEFTVDQFTNDCGEIIDDFEEALKFSISKKLLATMFYYEFKKISELLKDNSYNKNRNSDFPFQAFKTFEKEVLEYLN